MNKTNLPQSVINRFWSKVQKTPECWIWTAGCSGNGYGLFSYTINGIQIRITIHRFSWEYHYGPIPTNKLVCHHCDNKTCCNPSHLFLGDPKDNTRDMMNKGRLNGGWAPGEQHVNTNLTNDDVRKIKQLLSQGVYQHEIATAFNISQTTVSRIKLRKTWKSIN